MQAIIDFIDDPLAHSPSGNKPRLQKHFTQASSVLSAQTLDEVLPLLKAVDAHARSGKWCVGAVAYEAAPAFDRAMRTLAPLPAGRSWPLAQFAIYDHASDFEAEPAQQAQASNTISSSPWSAEWSEATYATAFEQVQAAIAAGECYQINLTHALRAGIAAQPSSLFHALRAQQPDGYCAWLDFGDQQLLSVSPELFFDWRPDDKAWRLAVQPMKGTAARYLDPIADAYAGQHLLSSDKERAENLMIVDLLRNDLGRIARIGSVHVDKLFELHKLPTVWQMTSTVSCHTRDDTRLADIFRALFPCGSVTGAPKVRAMHWVAALEQSPRGVYCGAIGVVRPGGAATFNVPIRTLMLSAQAPARKDTMPHWQARYSVGSGLTSDAIAHQEWVELDNKSLVLARTMQRLQGTPLHSEAFALFETLRLENGQYWLLDEHLSRLMHSAKYFGMRYELNDIRQSLSALANKLEKQTYRVRLTLQPNGSLQLEHSPLPDTPVPARCVLDSEYLHTQDPKLRPFIEHKTTLRKHYERATDASAFDTLLKNEKGELTEFTRGNVALLIEGVWYTPPLSAGLLPGTYRAKLVRENALHEMLLTKAHLQQATKIAYFNSLRGWLEVTMDTHTPMHI